MKPSISHLHLIAAMENIMHWLAWAMWQKINNLKFGHTVRGFSIDGSQLEFTVTSNISVWSANSVFQHYVCISLDVSCSLALSVSSIIVKSLHTCKLQPFMAPASRTEASYISCLAVSSCSSPCRIFNSCTTCFSRSAFFCLFFCFCSGAYTIFFYSFSFYLPACLFFKWTKYLWCTGLAQWINHFVTATFAGPFKTLTAPFTTNKTFNWHYQKKCLLGKLYF